jgi:hypothetical protein
LPGFKCRDRLIRPTDERFKAGKKEKEEEKRREEKRREKEKEGAFHLLVPHLQPGVHTHDTPHRIPITHPNQLSHTNISVDLTVSLQHISDRDNRRWTGFNLAAIIFRPYQRFPEIACAEKVDVERKILVVVPGLRETPKG